MHNLVIFRTSLLIKNSFRFWSIFNSGLKWKRSQAEPSRAELNNLQLRLITSIKVSICVRKELCVIEKCQETFWILANSKQDQYFSVIKFIYYEKVTKICEISTLLLSVCTVDKSKVEISQNFVAFSDYTNFTKQKMPEAALTNEWFELWAGLTKEFIVGRKRSPFLMWCEK